MVTGLTAMINKEVPAVVVFFGGGGRRCPPRLLFPGDGCLGPILNHLSGCGCAGDGPGRRDRTACCAGCPNLNYLSIGGCRKVTDVGIERLG